MGLLVSGIVLVRIDVKSWIMVLDHSVRQYRSALPRDTGRAIGVSIQTMNKENITQAIAYPWLWVGLQCMQCGSMQGLAIRLLVHQMDYRSSFNDLQVTYMYPSSSVSSFLFFL